MKNITTVGVDLAKEVIQVCVVTRGTVISNTEMTPQEFRCFITKMKACIIVFEACATSIIGSKYLYRKVMMPTLSQPN